MQIIFFLVGVFLQWTLEVLGAGGAIWGMSEVWHIRGGTASDPNGSNDALRIPANIVFVLGFIRMFFRYSPGDSPLKFAVVDPQTWIKNRAAGKDVSVGMMYLFETVGFLLGFFLQWDLEVLGAGGACWGMSEVWKWRAAKTSDPEGTNHDWRWVCNIVFTVGIFRMAQKYLPDHAIHTAMLSPQVWVRSLTVAVTTAPKNTQQGQEMAVMPNDQL